MKKSKGIRQICVHKILDGLFREGIFEEVTFEQNWKTWRSKSSKYLGEEYTRHWVQQEQQTGGESKFVLCQQQNVTELE